MECPCGSGEPLDRCCEPLIEGQAKGETPEAVMRARYTAYVIGKTRYILESNAPETADDVDLEATEQWSQKADWEGFELIESLIDENEDKATVEFVARYSVEEKHLTHHERSTFVRRDGAWLFLDGETVKPQPIRREGPRIGRNDPCPCGSGKKYKRCCAA